MGKTVLTPAKVKRFRRAIEKLYVDTCTITDESYLVKNVKTKKSEPIPNVICENQPCFLDEGTGQPVTEDSPLPHGSKTVKLFIAPERELQIPPGCKVVVVSDGQVKDFYRSSISDDWGTHQEIDLIDERHV